MKNNAEVLLSCTDDSIFVEISLEFFEPITEFVFSINKHLTLEEVKSEVPYTLCSGENHTPLFQVECQEIRLSFSNPTKNFNVAYRGLISGWANIVSEERIALSMYSSWFPQKTNHAISMKFIILNLENYQVLHSKYDSQRNAWIYDYDDSGYDPGNIIALNPEHYRRAQQQGLNVYFLKKETGALAGYFQTYYRKVIDYYQNTFGVREIATLNIVSLGIPQGSGAYLRKNLLVFESTPDVKDGEEEIRTFAIGVLAHELAHVWFGDAPTDSWEDWLNETGANWSALLYVLDNKDLDLFNVILDMQTSMEDYTAAPVIRSADGVRPRTGVHARGTMLFYEIYKAYGKATIHSLLQCLLSAKEKNTFCFLETVKSALGEDFAMRIENALEAESYKDLFVLPAADGASL